MQIDTSTEFGARVEQRLLADRIIWLVTTDGSGAPQPSPVWFLWDGETAMIYSQPNTPKVRNIADNPLVSFHFNSDEYGGDVVIFTAEASIEPEAPPASAVPAYIDKYDDGMKSISMTPESFAAAYSVPVRLRPTALRGH